MKIVTNVISSDVDYNGDCDYAFVDISPIDAKSYLKYMDKAKELKSEIETLYCFQLFNYAVDYFCDHDAFDELGYEIVKSDDNLIICPEDYKLPKDTIQRTECAILRVCDDEISWNALIKHTGVKVSTCGISRKVLEKIAKSS